MRSSLALMAGIALLPAAYVHAQQSPADGKQPALVESVYRVPFTARKSRLSKQATSALDPVLERTSAARAITIAGCGDPGASRTSIPYQRATQIRSWLVNNGVDGQTVAIATDTDSSVLRRGRLFDCAVIVTSSAPSHSISATVPPYTAAQTRGYPAESDTGAHPLPVDAAAAAPAVAQWVTTGSRVNAVAGGAGTEMAAREGDVKRTTLVRDIMDLVSRHQIPPEDAAELLSLLMKEDTTGATSAPASTRGQDVKPAARGTTGAEAPAATAPNYLIPAVYRPEPMPYGSPRDYTSSQQPAVSVAVAAPGPAIQQMVVPPVGAPSAPVQKVWILNANHTLRDSITEWARSAGWKVPEWKASDPYNITQGGPLTGGFLDALRTVESLVPHLAIKVNPQTREILVTDAG
ncbi:hypothetical protein LMG22037_05543 [Paraburkholderia phenoliruptrix]|jgi:hypothetical protein|uniref:Toxin co-regulated pilus biosynthesis protein Q C-terminal domain-containing protein n=1 Tax=Paraburkholderia phenoliruptrix TaxID=252970 RepID=A0A6J5CBS4_9BURK|nr:TcpQ domain-containing protein [Paraburkholderia phenoliruptrix]CAB3730560.1 hypothetical protein LMG22037_05543 [Paraburkholderia phenoliruptrix]